MTAHIKSISDVHQDSDYGKAYNIIATWDAKQIFNRISGDIFIYSKYSVSSHSGYFEDENSVAEIIMQVAKIASTSFVKDIAEKLFERKSKQEESSFNKMYNIGLSTKQAWCVAFDIEKNRETYCAAAATYIVDAINRSIDREPEIKALEDKYLSKYDD